MTTQEEIAALRDAINISMAAIHEMQAEIHSLEEQQYHVHRGEVIAYPRPLQRMSYIMYLDQISRGFTMTIEATKAVEHFSNGGYIIHCPDCHGLMVTLQHDKKAHHVRCTKCGRESELVGFNADRSARGLRPFKV